MRRLKSGASILLLTKLAEARTTPNFISHLEYEPLDMVVKVIRGTAEGLNLYEHVDKLTVCDYHIQSFFSTLVDSASTFYGSAWETDLLREGLWLFTDSMGLSSYALRTCHRSKISL